MFIIGISHSDGNRASMAVQLNSVDSLRSALGALDEFNAKLPEILKSTGQLFKFMQDDSRVLVVRCPNEADAPELEERIRMLNTVFNKASFDVMDSKIFYVVHSVDDAVTDVESFYSHEALFESLEKRYDGLINPTLLELTKEKVLKYPTLGSPEFYIPKNSMECFIIPDDTTENCVEIIRQLRGED